MSILKVDITLVHWFFLIFQLLVPKIEICLKYFLDKNSPKRPLWYILLFWRKTAEGEIESATIKRIQRDPQIYCAYFLVHLNWFRCIIVVIRTIKCNTCNTKGGLDILFQLCADTYCKVASSNTSCLEAHAGFFRLLM